MFRREFVCKWCHNRPQGCILCDGERKKHEAELEAEYNRQFPNGPQPFFTAKTDDPQQMEELKEVLHREKVEKAMSPGGGGFAAIIAKATEIMQRRESEQNKQTGE